MMLTERKLRSVIRNIMMESIGESDVTSSPSVHAAIQALATAVCDVTGADVTSHNLWLELIEDFVRDTVAADREGAESVVPTAAV